MVLSYRIQNRGALDVDLQHKLKRKKVRDCILRFSQGSIHNNFQTKNFLPCPHPKYKTKEG